jgi:hypothetical protein
VGNILGECPASVTHYCQKIEYLLKAYKLKEALQFSQEMMQNPLVKSHPRIIGWRGRVLIYSGNDS